MNHKLYPDNVENYRNIVSTIGVGVDKPAIFQHCSTTNCGNLLKSIRKLVEISGSVKEVT